MISRFFPILSKLKALKQHGRLMWVAFRDQRTPLWIKVVMVATVLYLISPIDVVPDWLLILGLTDDLIVVTAVAWLLGKFIPQSVKDKANLPKPSQ